MVVYYVQYISHKNPYLVGRDETGKPAAVLGCGSFFFNKNFGMIFAEQIVCFLTAAPAIDKGADGKNFWKRR